MSPAHLAVRDEADPIEALVAEWNLWMSARRFSARTIEQRVMFARRWLQAFGGCYDQPPKGIEEYLLRFTGHTLRTYHDHLRALYRWLVETDRLTASPMDHVTRPPTPKPHPRPLSRAEATRAIAAAQGDMRAYILLGRLAGLRAHEIAKFAGEDIDAETISVLGKGGKTAVLPTHPALWELAQDYPRRGYWFPSPYPGIRGHITAHAVTMRVSRFFKSLGIEGGSHRNRHLYGTELLRAGANLRVVQELMRHSDIATTIRYLGVDPEERVRAIGALTIGT